MAQRVKAGDVLVLTGTPARIYLQYLGRHPEYGDAVMVSTAKGSDSSSIDKALFDGGYVAFYPAAAAVRRKLALIVGHLPSPGLPAELRRPGARVGREVRTWIILGEGGEIVKQKLSAEERRLPIAAIWNHELLIQRVAESWRPEMEGSNES